MKILLKSYPVKMALLVMLSMVWSAGCGGGVTTTPSAPGGGPSAGQKAVIALNTSGPLSSGTTIGGLGITLNLPDSVTVTTDANGNVDSSVVAASGVAAGQATVITLYIGAQRHGRGEIAHRACKRIDGDAGGRVCKDHLLGRDGRHADGIRFQPERIFSGGHQRRRHSFADGRPVNGDTLGGRP